MKAMITRASIVTSSLLMLALTGAFSTSSNNDRQRLGGRTDRGSISQRRAAAEAGYETRSPIAVLGGYASYSFLEAPANSRADLLSSWRSASEGSAPPPV